MIFKSSLLAALAAILSVVSSHPGEKHDKREALKQAEVRHLVADLNKRALDRCSGSSEVQARKERAMNRRLGTFKRLRDERGLIDHPYFHRRDNAAFAKWSQVSHDSSLKYTTATPEATVFASNTTCILTPDNADGPYFVLGEHIRSNVVENAVGVPLHLEMQFVDVSTCKPATELLIDIWSCNATGVYSGVSAAGEGGLQSTFLRGVQPTDADGVVQFDTLFPGHYQGRANHQHVIAHVGAQQLSNGTYSGGHIAHLSQLFFDESLLNKVEASSPYNKNTIARTSNSADLFTGYSATANFDPFPEYIMLGSALSDGILMWIEIGLNTSANYDSYAPYASVLGANGGKDNPQFASEEYIVGQPPPSHG